MDERRAKDLLLQPEHTPPGASFVCDPDCIVRAARGTGLAVMALDNRDIVGRRLEEVIADESDKDRIGRAHEAALEGECWNIRCRHGSVELACQIAPLNSEGEGTLLIAVPLSRELESDREAEPELNRDSVTGTFTRMALRSRAQGLIDRAPDVARVAVRLRVDGMRRINQAFGQDLGDRALRRVADRFHGALQDGEYLARVSGNEFMIFSNRATKAQVSEFVEYLASLFEEPVRVGQHDFMFRLQTGIAFYPQDGYNAPELGRRTAVALERARDDDLSHAFFSEEWEAELAAQGWVPGDLKQALRGDQLEIHYQPLFNRQGDVAWMEALLRWPHPDRGMISPGVFIPIAEGTTLMRELDFWVLERACMEAKQVGLPVAINVTPDTLATPDFLSKLDRCLEHSGLPFQWLTLELTERVFSRPETTNPLLKGIRERDILVAVDDFGVGYSALSHLWQYPIDEIKLDGTFLRAAERNERAREIIHGVVAMAGYLDTKLVAEQVESGEESKWLQEVGVAYQQGFYHCRPLPVAALRDWLLQRQATRTED